MAESRARSRVVKALNRGELHGVAIENGCAAGTPDINFAGGWIDQPFISKLTPDGVGSMVVVAVYPDSCLMSRCGMGISTRRIAAQLWGETLPDRDSMALTRELYEEENRGQPEPSGSISVQLSLPSSQDSEQLSSPSGPLQGLSAPVQEPAAQVSISVQYKPSSQPEPAGSSAGQESLASSHDSAQSWSPSGPLQGSPLPVHIPALQASVSVQNKPSAHELPVEGPQFPSDWPPASILHAWQSFRSPPPHSLSQQTSSMQLPERQSSAVEQVPPMGEPSTRCLTFARLTPIAGSGRL